VLPALLNDRLEVKPQLGCVAPWCQEVCSAKCRQEIVERNLVGDIYSGEPKTPLVLVTAKQVVIPYGNVEQVTRGNTRRIVIIILSSRRGNRNPC